MGPGWKREAMAGQELIWLEGHREWELSCGGTLGAASPGTALTWSALSSGLQWSL